MATRKKAKPNQLEHYLALPYTFRVAPDPTGGYVADVQELPGCMTQADTWEALRPMILDAMRGWIELRLDDRLPVPEPEEPAVAGRGT